MDRFAELRALRAVAITGGFSAAARQLGVATSSVARLMDALELRIGAPLLNRSTRSVTLTDPGREYVARATSILEQLEEADNAVGAATSVARGLLRIAAPVTFSSMFIAPLLPELARRYPELELDMRLNDSVTNLVEESIDLAIRIGTVERIPNLVARKLSTHQRFICASPAYLARHGAPRRPADLGQHNCLLFAYSVGAQQWHLRDAAGIEEIEVRGTLTVNNVEVLRQAVVGGVGLGLLPEWLVKADLGSGALVRVLEQYEINPGPMEVGVYGLYPASRRGSAKVKAVLDMLAAALAAQSAA
ncbi:MAG: HTH-type transcriptional regulator DmlR [Massilia sp.]|nr:HTH-type transcriptional regulator DmlR [Massilia sp.]